MGPPRIDEWAQGRFGFYVDRAWDGRRWKHERAPIKLAPYHARILAHVFTPDGDGRLPYDTVAWCEPCKSGKTAIAALIAKYVALHGEQNSQIVLASNKQDQAASLMFKSLTDSIQFNPHLRARPGRYDVTFQNGNTIKAIPSNSRTEAGARFSLAIFDELWGYVYTDLERLWAEFKSDPTRTNCVKLAVGYAGYANESELWHDLLTNGMKGQPVPHLADIEDGRGRAACWQNGRQFTFWSHECKQPWQSEAWKKSLAQQLTPGEYARMVETDFAASEETFVRPEWWDACQENLPILKPGDKTPLVIGIDASVTGACSALVAVSRHPRRPTNVAVRFCHVWNPAELGGEVIQSQTIEPTLRHLIENYNVICVCYDEFQLAKMVQDFRQDAKPVWFFKFPQGGLREVADHKLRQLIINRQVSQDSNPILREHVALNSAVKVTGDSRLRIVPKSRKHHTDACVALSMAAYQVLYLNL